MAPPTESMYGTVKDVGVSAAAGHRGGRVHRRVTPDALTTGAGSPGRLASTRQKPGKSLRLVDGKRRTGSVFPSLRACRGILLQVP